MANSKEAKYSVWFKDYTGRWVEWTNKFPSMRSASHGLAYVKQKFALNGQAGVFRIGYTHFTNDLSVLPHQLESHKVVGNG